MEQRDQNNMTEEPKKKYKLQEVLPDPLYESVVVGKFINHVMKKGKKTVARKIVYSAFEDIKKQTKRDPLEVFETALNNVTPSMEVRSKRVGGATYQVPMKVNKKRAISLTMRWINDCARSKKGRPMYQRLSEEILNASNNEGDAIKKKDNMHRMAKANKAFAYLAK